MNHHIFKALLLITAGLGIVSFAAAAGNAAGHPGHGVDTAVAQNGSDIDVNVGGDDQGDRDDSNENDNETLTQIDPATTLVESEVVDRGGQLVARLTLRSDIQQLITLTDAGGVWEGGEVTTRRIRLDEGETTVEIPVTETDQGGIAVTIATDSVLYAVPLQAQRGGLLPEDGDDSVAFLVGLTLPVIATRGWLWYRARSVSDSLTEVG
jgi:hypothetical protein